MAFIINLGSKHKSETWGNSAKYMRDFCEEAVSQ
jgi:hypothetical protein